jgi:predicted nucleotidyltransferase
MRTLKEIRPFLKRVISWVEDEPGIVALALVGSYARDAAREDSDIDLILIAEDPGGLLADQSWPEQFGEIRQKQVEDYGKVISLRVFYAHGPEVEFGLAGRDWPRQPLDEGTHQVIHAGMRVLFEREPILSTLLG